MNELNLVLKMADKFGARTFKWYRAALAKIISGYTKASHDVVEQTHVCLDQMQVVLTQCALDTTGGGITYEVKRNDPCALTVAKYYRGSLSDAAMRKRGTPGWDALAKEMDEVAALIELWGEKPAVPAGELGAAGERDVRDVPAEEPHATGCAPA